jgi:hypothetical protein
MLAEIFERHEVPPAAQQSLEIYLRDPLSVSESVRVRMSDMLSNNPQLFDDCIIAMKEEFQLAKRTHHDV